MPVEEQLEIISDQLDLLELNHLIGKKDHDKILSELQNLKKEPDKFKEYAEAFSDGLPGVTKGVISLAKLGKEGDPFAISIACLDVFSGIVAMAGPLLGPVGPLISALTGMISAILGEFLPKAPNLKDQIEELLNKFLADEKLRALGTAADQIWVLSDTIQNHSQNYKPLNLQHGTEIKAIDDAWQWLTQQDKQTVAQWDQVLEKTCQVWLQLVRCVALSVMKPSTRAGVAKDDMLVYLPARQELFLKYLREIEPVAQDRGLYLMTQSWSNGLVLYVAVGRQGALPWDYKRNIAWLVNVSIHVPQSQLGASTPKYEVIALAYGPRKIFRHQVDSVTGDFTGGSELMVNGVDYPNLGGGTRRFIHCVNAWALADWEKAGRTRIYTVHAGEDNYVNVHVVDKDDKVNRINWEPRTSSGIEHVRAVVRDISQSLPDDPDAVALESRQYEIIYGGYRSSPNLWVATDNDWRDVPSPWPQYHGIEVDSYGVWVFGEKGIAFATHASVIVSSRQRRNGQSVNPKWITFKTGWTDGFNVKSLCACSDGILAVGSDQPAQGGLVLWTGPYQITLKAPARLEWKYHGKTREGSPLQVLKMPIPCWPLFAKVKQDLENEVGDHHHG
jgi:hypothetical protein